MYPLVIEFLCFIICVLYIRFGIYYAKGMAEYARFNNVPPNEENCWSSVANESRELWEAILCCNPMDILLEASDVIHALIKYIVINYLPRFLFCHIICWLPVFLVVLPCSIKLGNRYREHRCIRNHQNKGNRNHLCKYNGKYR